jgi:elongation factor G
MLFSAGATSRLTRVDEGNTITDFDEEEINRKLTISTAVAALEWKKKKLNLLDTPGFNLFMYDTKTSMAAADAALIVVDGVSGVEVMTERVWQYAEEFNQPRAFFINKLDRERSDFQRTVDAIQEVFGRPCIPVHLPIGSERDFTGIVDIIHMKAFSYTPDGDGKG